MRAVAGSAAASAALPIVKISCAAGVSFGKYTVRDTLIELLGPLYYHSVEDAMQKCSDAD